MNVRAFRKDLSKHMDEAEKGKQILVTRGNKIFELRPFGVEGKLYEANIDLEKDEFVPVEKPLDKTDYHPAPGKWTLPEPQNQIEPLNKESKDYSLCKHSAVKGFCKKGCK